MVRLRIEESEHLWQVERSPEVGAKATCYDHTEEMVWRHLNVFEHECEIRCRLPRGKCTQSGKVYRVRPPWEGLCKHFTKSFEAMALLLMREMPVAAVGRMVGETDTRLWRMLKAHVAVAYPQSDWSGVICLGCDEMSVRKGQNYVSVFCDLIGKRVLFAVEGRDKSVWNEFAKALEEHNGHPRAIREISMDMSPAYISGADENIGSQAQIVFDKYHVIAHANQAVDAVRRCEMRLGKAAARDTLKETRWIWLKNPENLTDKQKAKYRKIDQQNLATAKAYQMRLTFQDIYDIPHRGLAKRKLLAWCRGFGGLLKSTSVSFLPHAPMYQNGGVPSSGHPRSPGTQDHQCLPGWPQQRLLCFQTQGPWLPFNSQPHHHALLHRLQVAHPCYPLKTAKNHLQSAILFPISR